MVGELVTFPVRAGVRGARMVLRAAEEVTGRAVSNAFRVVSALSNDGSPIPTTAQRKRGERQEPQARPREESELRRAPANGTPQSTDVATEPEPAGDSPAADLESSVPAPSTEVEVSTAEQATVYDEPTEIEPAHVSEEPELVREEAERGAEDGAGATVTVREPWDGYARMSAKEIIGRLGDATAAELAAVQLYESANRSRQTVLDAIERQLKNTNGSR